MSLLLRARRTLRRLVLWGRLVGCPHYGRRVGPVLAWQIADPLGAWRRKP